MAIVRYFDADKYDGTLPLGGVPLADIDDEDWERLPQYVRDSADALPYFRKTKPTPAARATRRIEADTSDEE